MRRRPRAQRSFVPDDCEAMPGDGRGLPVQGGAERRLLGAMLCQAAVDANEPRMKHGGSARTRAAQVATARREARDWVIARGDDVGGFQWVCEALGLNADAVAAEILLRWTREHTRRVLWMLRGGNSGRRVVARRLYRPRAGMAA